MPLPRRGVAARHSHNLNGDKLARGRPAAQWQPPPLPAGGAPTGRQRIALGHCQCQRLACRRLRMPSTGCGTPSRPPGVRGPDARQPGQPGPPPPPFA